MSWFWRQASKSDSRLSKAFATSTKRRSSGRPPISALASLKAPPPPDEGGAVGGAADLGHDLVDAAELTRDVGVPHVVEVAARGRAGVVGVGDVAERDRVERPLGHLEDDLERPVQARQRVGV